MTGRFTTVQSNGKRICYSCGSGYPDDVRFCPRDSTDLEYRPQNIEDLGNFGQAGKCLAPAVISILLLVIAVMLVLGRLNPAPAAKPSGVGVLTVRTSPPGAVVYLDGAHVGMSPIELSGIPTGVHEVRAAFPGYSDGKAQIEILPSATQRLVWDLSPLPLRDTKERNKFLVSLPAMAAGSELLPEDPI